MCDWESISELCCEDGGGFDDRVLLGKNGSMLMNSKYKEGKEKGRRGKKAERGKKWVSG